MANASIFQTMLRPPKSMLDYGEEMDRADLGRLQLEGQRGQNALLALTREQQAAQARQAIEKQRRLQQYAAQHKDPMQFEAAILADPLTMDVGEARRKARLDAGRVESQTEGDRATAGKTNYETERKKFDDAIIEAAGMRTPEAVRESLSRAVRTGKISMQDAQARMQSIPQDPAQMQQWRLAMLAQVLEKKDAFEAQKPVLGSTNLGGTEQYTSRDPISGAVTVNSTAARTMTPGDVATNSREWARINDARKKEVAGTEGEDPAQAALIKKFGKPEAGRRWKPDGSLEPIPGGSADRKTNEQTAGKETVDSVVASLRSSYDKLAEGGGITSTEKGPLDNISAAVSKSAVGQTLGGWVGGRNQKERDAIAQARPLLLQAIMKATGMSAKQMDSNVELKLYLATATDPTLSLEANRQALDRIEQLYGSGALNAKPATPASGPARINSDAEYNALPSGATFIGPDGKTRRKP